jgi:FHIPEP family
VTTEQIEERWRQWLRGLGAAGVARPVRAHAAGAETVGSAPELLLREVFVRAEPAERRGLDLLVVALIERDPSAGDAGRGELVVIGPDALRAQTASHSAGIVATDLRLGLVGAGVRSASLALVRIGRRTRSHDIASSIEDLGRLLEPAVDPVGSAAVAQAVLSRLEVLTAGPEVRVSVAGAVTNPWLDAGPDTLYLLADAAAPVGPDEGVELRDGRLAVTRGSRSAAWRGDDYLLLQTGRRTARRRAARSVAQLRREHALVEGHLGAETERRADTYSSRAATVRQTLWAERIVADARGGGVAEAAELLRFGLAQPGAEGPLLDQITGQVTTADDYWSVVSAVERVLADPGETAAAGKLAEELDRRLGERLDAVLGLAPGPEEVFHPVPTPIVLEVSDAIVPIVDNRQDGGYFLFELIPEIRQRIRDTTGVRVSGVRARGSSVLAPGQFGIQLDEAWVVHGSMLTDGEYVLRSIGESAVGAGVDFTEIHPLTGEWGRWRIDPAHEGEDTSGEPLSRARYLAHRVDLAVRAGLRRFLGRQETEAMVEQWRAADTALVATVLPDDRAMLRLTLVLQDLVDERVPIKDWRDVLDAVAEAGGTSAAVPALRRAVRYRLREQLPGPRSGALLVPVPDDIQAALAGTGFDKVSGRARHELLRWLRATVAAAGPGIAVVAHEPSVRERIAVLARAERDVVMTFSDDELER